MVIDSRKISTKLYNNNLTGNKNDLLFLSNYTNNNKENPHYNHISSNNNLRKDSKLLTLLKQNNKNQGPILRESISPVFNTKLNNLNNFNTTSPKDKSNPNNYHKLNSNGLPIINLGVTEQNNLGSFKIQNNNNFYQSNKNLNDFLLLKSAKNRDKEIKLKYQNDTIDSVRHYNQPSQINLNNKIENIKYKNLSRNSNNFQQNNEDFYHATFTNNALNSGGGMNSLHNHLSSNYLRHSSTNQPNNFNPSKSRNKFNDLTSKTNTNTQFNNLSPNIYQSTNNFNNFINHKSSAFNLKPLEEVMVRGTSFKLKNSKTGNTKNHIIKNQFDKVKSNFNNNKVDFYDNILEKFRNENKQIESSKFLNMQKKQKIERDRLLKARKSQIEKEKLATEAELEKKKKEVENNNNNEEEKNKPGNYDFLNFLSKYKTKKDELVNDSNAKKESIDNNINNNKEENEENNNNKINTTKKQGGKKIFSKYLLKKSNVSNVTPKENFNELSNENTKGITSTKKENTNTISSILKSIDSQANDINKTTKKSMKNLPIFKHMLKQFIRKEKVSFL